MLVQPHRRGPVDAAGGRRAHPRRGRDPAGSITRHLGALVLATYFGGALTDETGRQENEWDGQQRQLDYLQIRRHALEMVANPDLGLVLGTGPCRIRGGFYNRSTHTLYLASRQLHQNLALSDRLGRMRMAMERAGVWDRTVCSFPRPWARNEADPLEHARRRSREGRPLPSVPFRSSSPARITRCRRPGVQHRPDTRSDSSSSEVTHQSGERPALADANRAVRSNEVVLAVSLLAVAHRRVRQQSAIVVLVCISALGLAVRSSAATLSALGAFYVIDGGTGNLLFEQEHFFFVPRFDPGFGTLDALTIAVTRGAVVATITVDNESPASAAVFSDDVSAVAFTEVSYSGGSLTDSSLPTVSVRAPSIEIVSSFLTDSVRLPSIVIVSSLWTVSVRFPSICSASQ